MRNMGPNASSPIRWRHPTFASNCGHKLSKKRRAMTQSQFAAPCLTSELALPPAPCELTQQPNTPTRHRGSEKSNPTANSKSSGWLTHHFDHSPTRHRAVPRIGERCCTTSIQSGVINGRRPASNTCIPQVPARLKPLEPPRIPEPAYKVDAHHPGMLYRARMNTTTRVCSSTTWM